MCVKLQIRIIIIPISPRRNQSYQMHYINTVQTTFQFANLEYNIYLKKNHRIPLNTV